MKILVPIDLNSEASWTSALPQAFRTAEAMQGELTIMTVVPEILAGLDWRYSIRGETGGSEDFDSERLVADAAKRLEEIGEQNAPEGAEFDVVARYGSVFEEILAVAAELPADQIVMAARHPSLADYLIGPTTDRIVRHAPCSVLVVRD